MELLRNFDKVKKIHHSDANFILFEIEHSKGSIYTWPMRVVCRYRGARCTVAASESQLGPGKRMMHSWPRSPRNVPSSRVNERGRGKKVERKEAFVLRRRLLFCDRDYK